MTNGNPQQLVPRINYRAFPCDGCGQMAIITLEWYTPVVIASAPLLLTAAGPNPPPGEQQVVGHKMYTLCMNCLRREIYLPVWDPATRLPNWVRTEAQAGPGHLLVGNQEIGGTP